MDSVTASKQLVDNMNPQQRTRFHPWSDASSVCLFVDPALHRCMQSEGFPQHREHENKTEIRSWYYLNLSLHVFQN